MDADRRTREKRVCRQGIPEQGAPERLPVNFIRKPSDQSPEDLDGVVHADQPVRSQHLLIASGVSTVMSVRARWYLARGETYPCSRN